jgi:hypothetical protein
MKPVLMVATKRLKYAGEWKEIGDKFSVAKKRDVLILVHLGKAARYTEPPKPAPVVKKLSPLKKTAEKKTTAKKAAPKKKESDVKPSSKTEKKKSTSSKDLSAKKDSKKKDDDEKKGSKGKYSRKDMRAED